jgi:hypothetical protein
VRRDPNHVEHLQLDHLVVELDLPGARDDHIGLLLLLVVVPVGRHLPRRVPEQADPKFLRVDVFPREPRLDVGTATEGVIDLQQVFDRVVAHARESRDGPPARSGGGGEDSPPMR